MMIKRLLVSLLCCLPFFVHAQQVEVNINSGNPDYPFPQFLDYGENRQTLASHTPPGVTHAEMEQWIRDAWQIMANRFEYVDSTHAGVQYIIGNEGCPYDCSEGDGYALIAAAYMGDKETFDGLWFRTHDTRMITYPSYIDGNIAEPNYPYGDNTLKDNDDAASDGSFDIALGLLMAWKQWGPNSGYVASNGDSISYKKEAIRVIRGLVETTNRDAVDDCRSTSGSIGFDGYIKSGNTGPGEMTGWAPTTCPGPDSLRGLVPEFAGPNGTYIDYAAPSYFREFAGFLDQVSDSSSKDWNINQFLRAEASSDWLMGQMINVSDDFIPVVGNVNKEGGSASIPEYNNVQASEDDRCPWRTVLNYVWHGNPETSWDPVNHTVINEPNTYEYDIANRFARFMKDERQAPWNNDCRSMGDPGLTYYGPPQLSGGYDSVGNPTLPVSNIYNWLAGTGSPSAIASQDFGLMGDLFNQCTIEWDAITFDSTDRYLTSEPTYFHGFFRLIGMQVLTGNHHGPMQLEPKSNMKIYCDVDKTFGFTRDTVTYTLTYRNYASFDAENVVIRDTLSDRYTFVSANKGGTYDAGNRVISWDIGSVPGFNSSDGKQPTIDSVQFKVLITGDTGRICNTVSITTSNGYGWTSNEYPNNITTVMERNCVDIIKRALRIDKEVSEKRANPGDSIAYKVSFKNSSEAGWLNGGRPGVRFAYAHDGIDENDGQQDFRLRIFHGAVEPYINYENYRISYFVNQPGYDSIPDDWQLFPEIYEGGRNENNVQFDIEKLVPGSDSSGAWDRRVIIQFANAMATTTPKLSKNFMQVGQIPKGVVAPFRAVWRLVPRGEIDWTDDWSANESLEDGDGGLYYPITPDYTRINEPGIPIDSWHPNACETANQTASKVLIEEWDGYTWRRIYGKGPAPGRELTDVVMRDTLPDGVTWGGFIDTADMGSTSYDPDSRVVTWEGPRLLVEESDSIQYYVYANDEDYFGGCPVSQTIGNKAWISASTESPIDDEANFDITCDSIIDLPDETSMEKTASQNEYEVGDTITYNIKYINTHGSIIQPDLNSDDGWNLIEGTPFNFSNGSFTTDNSNSSIGEMMTYQRSHGQDGTIEVTVDEMNNYAKFSIVLRHNGNGIEDGSYITFKRRGTAVMDSITFWNGTERFGFAAGMAYPEPATPARIKIKMEGENVQIWINDFSGQPLISQDGFTVQTGLAGVLNGAPDGNSNYATHSVSNFLTHLDSGWDVYIEDPIPGPVSFIDASGGGTVDNSTITWPTTNTDDPLLAGDSVSVSWTGEITEDADSITNLAYTHLQGITEEIGASSTIYKEGYEPPECTKTFVAEINNNDSLEICDNASVTLEANEDQTAVYAWYHNGNKVAGPAENGFQYDASEAGDYFVVIADSGQTANLEADTFDPETLDSSCYARSEPVHISVVSVQETHVAVSSDADSATCEGESLSFTVDSLAPEQPDLAYQWQRNGTDIEEETSQSLSLENWQNDDEIRLIVSNYQGCTEQDRDTSNIINLQGETLITPSVSISAAPDTVNCIGTEIAFSIDTLSPDRENLSYEWLRNGNSIADSDTTAYSTDTWEDQDQYSLVVSNFSGCVSATRDTSNAITLESTDVLTPFVSIDVSPSTLNCTGDSISFSIDSVAGGGSQPEYQWLRNGNEISGATNSTYITDGWSDNDNFSLIMDSDASCASPSADTSEALTINETDPLSPEVEIDGTQSDELCEGDTVAFAVSSTSDEGASPAFTWLRNGNILNGETGESVILTNWQDGDEIEAIMEIQETCNTQPSDTSNSIVLEGRESLTPSVTIEAQNDLPLCLGDSLHMVSDTTNGGVNPSVSWFIQNQEIGSGISITLAPETINDGDEIYAVMNSSLGCVTHETDTSGAVSINIVDPDVSINGTTSFCQGDTGQFTATIQDGGEDVSFNWMINDSIGPVSTTLSKSQLNDQDTIRAILSTSYQCANRSSDDTAMVIAEVQEVPGTPGPISGPAFVCRDDRYIYSIDSVSHADTYQWQVPAFSSIINGAGSVEIEMDIAERPSGGALRVTAINDCERTYSEELVIQEHDSCREDLFIPNAFSPGNGGESTHWKIEGIHEFRSVNIQVFNRWGAQVYQSDNYDTPWNGTHNGKTLPTGTYYYIINLNGGERTETGSVTILK